MAKVSTEAFFIVLPGSSAYAEKYAEGNRSLALSLSLVLQFVNASCSPSLPSDSFPKLLSSLFPSPCKTHCHFLALT